MAFIEGRNGWLIDVDFFVILNGADIIVPYHSTVVDCYIFFLCDMFCIMLDLDKVIKCCTLIVMVQIS